MTTVYFVRHAQPDFSNHDDLTRQLTAQGLKDRKMVTDFLRDKEIDVIFSSPYRRAVETIKEFADAKGLEITYVDDFRERKVGSDWIADFDKFSERQWEDFDFKLSDGESLREVQNRNINALNQILKNNREKNIVIGSHGTALSTVIHFYDASFGYEEFEAIKNVMPWIVKFTFEGGRCLEIQRDPALPQTSRCLIRKVGYEELDSAFSLIWRVFQQFVAPDYTEEGVAFFYQQFVAGHEFRERFRDGTQTMYGAFDQDQLVGVLSISKNNHVSCVFVAEAYQRKGIAKKLFQKVISQLKQQGAERIKLNASPYGVPFYHAMGFQDTDTETVYHGIRYTPMELQL